MSLHTHGNSPKGRLKVGKILGEFKRGTLRSSSGQKVTKRSQAIAIGLSVQRKLEERVKKAMRSKV